MSLLSSNGQVGDDSLTIHRARARAAQEHGDFERAATEWQAIIRIAPSIAEAYSNLGMMWHFGNHYQQAVEAFQKAIKLNSNLVAPHLFLGIDYYLISHPKQAVPELKTALSLDSRNGLARKWLGMSHFQLGNYIGAVNELELAGRAEHNDPDLLFWLSRAYSKLLFESHERIRQLAPASPYLQLLRGKITGDKLDETTGPETSGALCDLVHADPQSAEDWYQVGRCARALALKSLDAFLTRAPGAYQVHQLQAEHFLALGNEEQALSEYHAALVAKPDAIQIQQDIGNIFMSHHEYANAIPYYEAELRVDPYSLIALERVGQAYAELNKPERANGYLKRAVAIDSHSYEAQRALGKIYFAQRAYAAAVKHYLSAVESRPERDSSVLFQLSKAYRQVGNQVEADRWLAQFKREGDSELKRLQRQLSGAVSASDPSSEPSRHPVPR